MVQKIYNKKIRQYEYFYDEINDNTIIEIFVKNETTLNLYQLTHQWLEKYNDIKKYLDERYNDSNSYSEIIYRIYHHIDIHPICPVCGGLQKYYNFAKGYYKHCSTKCALNDPKTKQKCQNTKLKKYGNPNYHNIEKAKQTWINKYGVDNPAKSEIIKQKMYNTCYANNGVYHPSQKSEFVEKQKQTCIEKYGVSTYFNAPKCRQLAISPDAIYKSFQTKIKNGTINSSKIEQQFKEYLEQNYPNDFKYQYKSKLYPFNCDFYIKSLDLYIEINGSWTHGEHPFDENNQEDIIRLNEMKSKNTKFYNNAINTWTIRDVNKRNIAKVNNLNYLEIFSNKIDVCIQELNNYVKSLP